MLPLLPPRRPSAPRPSPRPAAQPARSAESARRTAAALALAALISPALAWDAVGHRIVTTVAMERLAEDPACPAWLNSDDARRMVADQSTVPDRWRSTKLPQLTHVNSPDHYINLELLSDFKLSLETLPPLRYEFIKAITLARAAPDFAGEPINPAADPARTREWPGFLPHAIAENYAKLQSAFKVERVLEQLNDPARKPQLEMARANAFAVMGVLAHYVGDAAQPLHTTKHHNGWADRAPNPNAFTTDRTLHAYIDGGVIRDQHIAEPDIRPLVLHQPAGAFAVNASDPWRDVLSHITRGYEQVEPLYRMEKSGELHKPDAKPFIAARLADGARMLGTLYAAAYASAAPTPKDTDEFLKYDNFVAPATPAAVKSPDAPPGAPASTAPDK